MCNVRKNTLSLTLYYVSVCQLLNNIDNGSFIYPIIQTEHCHTHKQFISPPPFIYPSIQTWLMTYLLSVWSDCSQFSKQWKTSLGEMNSSERRYSWMMSCLGFYNGTTTWWVWWLTDALFSRYQENYNNVLPLTKLLGLQSLLQFLHSVYL